MVPFLMVGPGVWPGHARLRAAPPVRPGVPGGSSLVAAENRRISLDGAVDDLFAAIDGVNRIYFRRRNPFRRCCPRRYSRHRRNRRR